MPDIVGERLPDREEQAVEAAIEAAGGDPRAAIRALLAALAEERAAALTAGSLGFRRGRQPTRRL